MEMKDFSLEGKVALVTGASYGIGFAIAEGMAKAGATIVFNDIKQELVDKGLAAYREAGVEAHGYVCDVTDEDAVQAMVKQIAQEVGVVDILVNNAGITRDNLILRLTEQDFDRIYRRIREERAALEQRLREREKPDFSPARQAELAKELVRRFLDTATANRELLVSLIERVELTQEKNIIIKFRFRQLQGYFQE